MPLALSVRGHPRPHTARQDRSASLGADPVVAEADAIANLIEQAGLLCHDVSRHP